MVDEWVRCGIRHAAVCPGSRSAPLALALAARPEIDLAVHVDERSAAYYAVGIGRATGVPCVVVTTSGTAVANLLPAVVEANQAGVPLLLWTADRPHELRDVGANQAINQVGIFGSNVRWFQDLPLPEAAPGPLQWLRSVACRAVASATGPDPGPVHVNQPMREPLDASPESLPPVSGLAAGRPAGAPFHAIAKAPPGSSRSALVDIRLDGPGLIIAGPRSRVDGFPDAVWKLAQQLDVPVLADPLSQARFGAPEDVVLSAYDAWLGSTDVRARLQDAWILQFGAAPTSKNLRRLLQQHRGVRVIVDETGRGHDEVATASHIVQGDAVSVCQALGETLGPQAAPEGLHELDGAARALHEQADGDPQIIRAVLQALRAGDQLCIGSSLPVRDLDRYGAAGAAPAIRVFGNRGASGIDGVVATAVGAARAAPGARTLLLVGDLSLHHDLNGLASQARHAEGRLTTVVINNHGGGIFHHLPIAAHDRFEQLFATPHSWDVLRVAAGLGVAATRLVGPHGLDQPLHDLEGGLIEIIVDRAEAAQARRELQEQVEAVAAKHAD